MKQITFVTGNRSKYEDAQNLFSYTDLQVVMEKIDTPEIQANTSKEVVSFSATYLSEKLDGPFFIMDRSFHIKDLNGFPGPYVKYINDCLDPEQILSLIDKQSEREAYWETSIGCYIPGIGIEIFTGQQQGSLSTRPRDGKGWVVDKIFIPKEAIKALSQYSQEESTQFWNHCSCWDELSKFLQNNL